MNHAPVSFPGGPYAAFNTSVDYTNVGGGFGNSYYPSGANNVPFVVDLFNKAAANLTQNGMIGNKFQLHTVRLNGMIQTFETQSTYDQWLGRISILRLKQDGFAAGVTSNIGLVRYLQFPYTGANTTNSWYDCPWDLTKCKVLYEKKWHRHATPASVAAQVNCHFKAVPIRLKLKWRRGLSMAWNTQSNVSGTSATVTKVINPIIIVFQSGATGTDAPLNEALPAFFTWNAGSLYIGYRDA